MFWIINGIFLLFIIIGIIWYKEDNYSFGAMLITTIGGLLLVIELIALPIIHIDYNNELINFKSAKQTIEYQREDKDLTQYERATLTENIVSYNSWLAKAQYWNKKQVGFIVPDEVNELEPIQ
jgi:hypothetical protein